MHKVSTHSDETDYSVQKESQVFYQQPDLVLGEGVVMTKEAAIQE
jgi:hypothetical protein